MDELLHLHQGHLSNLSPRQRQDKRQELDAEAVENTLQEGNTSDLGGSSMNSTNSDSGTGAPTILRRTRQTKLPLPRDLASKSKEQQKDKPATPQNREYGSFGNVRPRISPTTLYSSPEEVMDKDREQYWRKVRDKFERESPLAKSKEKDKEKEKDKHKEPYYGAYKKIISLASSPRTEVVKQKLRSAGDELRGSPKTRIASPIIHPRLRPGYSSPSRLDNQFIGQAKRQLGGVQRKNSDTDESILHFSTDKTDNATDSSINSHSSLSPVSGPSSSLTEWEDKFVVNMPSAKEPNPPTMSAQQIAEFQQSIERVHNDGGAMLDPDSLPSPRTATPEDKDLSAAQPAKPTSFDGQDPPPPAPSAGAEESPSSPPKHPRYYCPDEIGKNRISTIWEESASKSEKDVPNVNPDGSFLGCKEINGPNDKNPDEILLFSPVDRPRVVDVSSPMSKSPKERKIQVVRQRNPDPGEKTVAREEWKPGSPNLKVVQCSKPSPRTMCRETSCQPPEKTAQGLSKEGLESTPTLGKRPEDRKPTPRDDDVFIITPTIIRTMVSMSDIKGSVQKGPLFGLPTSRTAGEIITDARARPQGKPSPLGLRRVAQNSQEKSNVSSPVPLRSAPARSIPVVKHRAEAGRRKVEQSRDMRGFIRMPGMIPPPSAESHAEPGNNPTQSRASSTGSSSENSLQVRRVTDSGQAGKSSLVFNISPVGSIDRGQPDGSRTVPETTKVIEVAELDGLQVVEHKAKTPPPRITPLRADPPNMEMEVASPTKSATNALTLALVLEIFILSAAQIEALWQRVVSNRRSKTALLKIAINGVLQMLEHCLQVLRTWLTVFSVYNATGVWPRPAEGDLARSVTDLCQAIAYLVVLCFMMMVVERAAGYIVLVGSWVVWFAKPFGWFFVTIGRALFT
ncbi:hypothetical protein CDV55_103804 [Aspergillus turcosus]|uniref:NTP binding protein n=1 Tax=Aspergillus turcosus TaxID=1245748 RepID=A0A229YSW7_9EURO|nr:hypothetical protein CDV55_103804 [Aspergillus turcosus]RLL98027.1 hypothetical protein CFD26_104137 [Aspergillus turcosus]